MGNEQTRQRSLSVSGIIRGKKETKVETPEVTVRPYNIEREENKTEEYSLLLKTKPESEVVAYDEVKPKFIGMADIEAPLFENASRAAVDIVCVLDTSGSMSGDRISLLRKSVRRLVRGVNCKDRLALIEFNSNSHVLLKFTSMDVKGKQRAKEIINTLGCWGGTHLSGGLLEGLKMVKRREKQISNEVCSILLFTDGEANYGIKETHLILKAAEMESGIHQGGTKPEGDPANWNVDDVCEWLAYIEMDLPKLVEQVKEMKIDGQILTHDLTEEMLEEDLEISRIHRSKFLREIEKLRIGEEDIKEPAAPPLSCTINTFGYGSRHNSDLLEKLAERFDGMYYYVKDSEAINEGFATCLGGLMSTVATNMQLSLTPVNGAKDLKVLSDFPTTVKNTTVTINVGEIQSEEHRHILFEIELPKAKAKTGTESYCSIKLSYDNAISSKTDILITEMKTRRGKVTTKRDELVDVQYNRVIAAEALSTADKLGKLGDLEKARTTLDTAFESVRRSMSCKMGMSRNLMQDMEQTRKGYTNMNEYQRWGRNYTKQNRACYRKERAVKVNDKLGLYSTQSQYVSLSKMKTVSAFDDSCSDDSDDAGMPQLRLTRALSARVCSRPVMRDPRRQSMRSLLPLLPHREVSGVVHPPSSALLDEDESSETIGTPKGDELKTSEGEKIWGGSREMKYQPSEPISNADDSESKC